LHLGQRASARLALFKFTIDFKTKKIFTKKDENSDDVLFGKSIHCHDPLACDCMANEGSELFITFLDLI